MSLVSFIGVDLAWSRSNPTGAATVRGDARGGGIDKRLRDRRSGCYHCV